MSENQRESETHPQNRAPLETRAPRMSALATLPVFFKLQGKRAVLSGGSEAAAWKAELLSAAGAEVHVYARAPSDAMLAVAASPPAGAVQIFRREWQADDLAGAAIAIGAIALDDATGEEDAAAFAAAARSAGVPVNVVDKPAFCDFQFGAIVNRSPLVVSISTDGGAPVFAQTIRSEIEALLPQGFKAWAEVGAELAPGRRTAGQDDGRAPALLGAVFPPRISGSEPRARRTRSRKPHSRSLRWCAPPKARVSFPSSARGRAIRNS